MRKNRTETEGQLFQALFFYVALQKKDTKPRSITDRRSLVDCRGAK